MSLDEAGTFQVRAVEAALGLAGNGTEQVAVLFEVIEEGEHKGKRITWYGYFTDAALARTIESLRHAGWQGADLGDLSTIGSAECSIVVDWESYEGSDHLRVKWVNAGGSGGLALKTRMDEAAKRAFAARMKGRVIAASGGKGAAKASAPAAGGRPAAQARPPAASAPPPAPKRFVAEWTKTACPQCGGAEYTLESGNWGCENHHQRRPPAASAPPPAPPEMASASQVPGFEAGGDDDIPF
jgi:hypothetical protein